MTVKKDEIVMVAPNPMNLAQKIVKVRSAIGGFSKDVKADKYKYVGGSQVLGKILATMDELGLLLIPNIVPNTLHWERYNYTRKYKSGGEAEVVDYLVEVHMIMTWKDADTGETLDVPWIALGEQESDIAKAFGSALTYTERYFLMKFFNQPTDGDDPDAKKEKDMEMTDEQKAQIESDRIANELISKVEASALEERLSKKGVGAKQIYTQCNVSTLTELKRFQYLTSMKLLEGMPDKAPKKQVE